MIEVMKLLTQSLKGKSKHTEFPPWDFSKDQRKFHIILWQGEGYLSILFNLADKTTETIFKGEVPKHRISPGIFEKIQGNST